MYLVLIKSIHTVVPWTIRALATSAAVAALVGTKPKALMCSDQCCHRPWYMFYECMPNAIEYAVILAVAMQELPV